MKLFRSFVSAAFVWTMVSQVAHAQGVLVIGAEEAASITDVKNKLAGTGLLSGPIDIFEGSSGTPTAEQLSNYKGVLFYSNRAFRDPNALGDLLANFVDQGGGVVQMTFSFWATSIPIGGRFRSQNYDLWTPGQQAQPGGLTLGTIMDPGHPIMAGVRTFRGGSSYHNTVGAMRASAELIANWSNGQPLVGVDTTTKPGRIVGLNFFPPSSTYSATFWDATTDGAILMANALNFAMSAVQFRHSCVQRSTSLHCWGLNGKGQLGLGHAQSIGDQPSEVGAGLIKAELGAFPVEKFQTAGESTCVLSSGKLKCFGRNDLGQLGLGDVEARGDQPNEMGEMLPPVDLGPGVTVKDFAMSGRHVCVITSTDKVKCFGANKAGQLGYGDTNNRGDADGEMGEALPYVELGTNAKAKQLALGDEHSCVLLEDNAVKCFGRGSNGRLGTGALADVGTAANQMGDALKAVDLGTSSRIAKLVAGRDFTCAQFDDRSLKCFGANGAGQLGLGDTEPRGTTMQSMGNNLPYVDLGSSQVASSLTCRATTCCAVLLQGTMKCWGGNSKGQLGLGDTLSRGGKPQEMGDELPQITLGNLTKIQEVRIQDDFVCARDERGWKCWGANRDGTLGYGDTTPRGHVPSSVPRLLPYLAN